MTIQFFVAGLPKTMSVGNAVRVPNKGGGFRQFQGRRHTEWAVLVGHEGRQHAPPTPFRGEVALTLLFLLPRPKSLPKKVEQHLKRPDIDNLFHKLTDQWNGVMWDDDSQITALSVCKRYAPDVGQPGVSVLIISEEGDVW